MSLLETGHIHEIEPNKKVRVLNIREIARIFTTEYIKERTSNGYFNNY